ncbi:innexin-11, partial [Trichinella spiralis]|uniref:innexin-11 n=1 Tax=Trichinella spiralis TaxID=6334 RepID=UPI0001EFD8E9
FHSTSGQRIAHAHCDEVLKYTIFRLSTISTLYIVVKLLYVLNAAFAILLDKYSIYGLGVIMDLLNGKEWEESGYFSKILLVRYANSYSRECSKAYCAMRATLADPSFRMHFYSSQVRAFVMDHLKLDGVFVLRMLSLHAGAMFTAELVLQIWRIFHPIIREKSTLMREQSRTTVLNNFHNLDDDLTFYDIHNKQVPQDVWPTRISQRLLSAEAAV